MPKELGPLDPEEIAQVESDLEQARRRAPIRGPLPSQEIPFFLPSCESDKDPLRLVWPLIGLGALVVAIILAFGSHMGSN